MATLRPEEEQVRAAMHDLLLYNPNRETLARRAVEWATRLVGAESAFIVDSDGAVLAVHGLSEADAMREAAHPSAGTFVIPLDLESGKGAMTIVASAVAPVFGEWELSRLRAYAVSVTAGLDRVSLTSRVAALEKAKSEFLNIASHELRGPMTVIKGYLTMIAAGSLGDVPSRTQAVLPLLIAKADEVSSLLEQMIEASRLEDGRMALKKERCDIAELTVAAIENLEPLLADHELKVEMPTRTVWAEVDPDRFQIVVRNLVSNAVKYSPAGSCVLVNVHSNRHSAILAVSDEGIGIAQDDKPKLFTRFGRVENRATAGTPGTGLGLWLSREIARMHDGDLTVESEPGKGSTFTLEIPLDRG
jgi:signal transduction histidine kinase